MIELLVYVVGIFLAFYMAWCLGANDAANPTECAVGAGVVSMKKALLLFVIFVAIGGILLGPFVMKTVDRGIIPREELDTDVVVAGSFSAVLAACLWVTFSSWAGIPVSTTHSTIGGVLGFGVVACFSYINWGKLAMVVISMVASPLLSIFVAWGLFHLFQRYFKKPRSERSNLMMIYILIFFLSFGTLVSVFKEVLKWGAFLSISSSLIASLGFSAVVVFALKKTHGKFEAEKSLGYLLIIALCFSAFAFGANDMANSTGVFVTPTQKLTGGTPTGTVMFLLAALGALGIAVGGFTWGYRVIMTSAYRITRLDPLSGAAAEYSNALTVFLFTVVPTFLVGFGIPISTTHSSIGSIIGVGLAMRGMAGVSRQTTSRILIFWALTIPAAALISGSVYWLLSWVMGI
ncbi:MAG: inorganic phosphate transporter [Hadesarchaea archaeon]|nr:inorganic phosphate transporter [Hadesarchaea archaeon]